MLKKIGKATDYRDLFYQYMSFLTCGLVGEDKVDSWCLIDPRLDSFFGSTMVVPIDNYKQKDDSVNIWVDMISSIISDEQNSSFYDNINIPNGKYNDLVSTLQYCYPNGTVVKVNEGLNQRGIEELYQKLQITPISDLPDIIISFGLLSTIESNNNDWDNYVNIELNNLFIFCNNNNIKLYCCVAPNQMQINLYDSLFNDIESFISSSGERLVNLPVRFVNMFLTLASMYSQFPNYGYSVSYQDALVRILLQEYLGLDRPEYYVSFEYRRITSGSYREFIYNYFQYQSEEFDNTEDGLRSINSKNGAKNPFRHSGQFVAVGLHTSYDWQLWMCEQGGITCKKEADEQINDIDLLPFWQFWSGAPQKRRDIPVYPGTGCPWMTIADVDISKYTINSNNSINYYFTKNSHNSTITVRISDSNNILPDCWQSIEYGMFTHIQDIIYPLYVGGGSVALSPDWWNYFALEHTYGELYNLSMKNPALCNSNILHTTKFGKANMSNFRVMDAGGIWKDIYSAYQEYKDIHYFTLSGFVPKWAECILEHTYDYSFNTGAELVDTRGKIGLQNLFRDSDKFNKAYDKYFDMDVLDNITVQINNHKISSTYGEVEYIGEGGNSLSYGTIPKVYASWARNIPQGINNIEGKYWLVIPNGWEDRLWHYKFYYGRIYWEGKNEKSEYSITERGLEQVEYVRDEYNILERGRENHKMITDKLVIDFGKAPISCSDLSIEFPSDYPTSVDVNLILRAYVHANSDNIYFSLYSQVDSIEVDFGDGSVVRFNFGEQIWHSYNSSGDYYINVYISSANDYYHCLKYVNNSYNNGFIYANGRNNLLKKLYLNPYCPDAIYIEDLILDCNKNATLSHGANIVCILNQTQLTDLYLPYLVNKNCMYSGSVNKNTWFSFFTIIGCVNLRNVYIFKDKINNYRSIWYKNNTACIYISGQFQNSVNVFVEDGFNSILINSFCVYSINASSNYESNISSAQIVFPNIDLYLYNKTLVSVNYESYSDVIYNGSNIILHVPVNLLEDYNKVYSNSNKIVNIIGDIS